MPSAVLDEGAVYGLFIKNLIIISSHHILYYYEYYYGDLGSYYTELDLFQIDFHFGLFLLLGGLP